MGHAGPKVVCGGEKSGGISQMQRSPGGVWGSSPTLGFPGQGSSAGKRSPTTSG